MISLPAVLFGLCSLILLGLYRYARIRYTIHRSSPKIPTLPGGLPFFGHLMQLNDPLKFVQEAATATEALGGVTKFWIGPLPFFNVTDPEVATTVMNECLQKTALLDMAETWVGQGIFTAKLHRWKRNRKLLNPTFNQQILDSFMGVFNAQGRRLVEEFEKKAGKGEFDPHHIMARNFLETVCQTSMGLNKNNLSVVDEEYIRCAERMFKIVAEHAKAPYPDFIYNWTSLKREEDKLVNHIKSVSRKVLELRKAESRNSSHQTKDDKISRKTFLELLVEQKDLSDEEILDEVNTMITAGFHTLETTVMVYLVVMGSYPEVQAKLYNELREVFGDSDRDVTKVDLGKLVYMEATLKEAMRLWPVGPVLVREALQDIKFDSWKIPKGTDIFVSFCALHRSKTLWGPDADEFRPERWLNPATIPDSPGSYAAFGLGRRACIGKSYAYMNMKTAMSHAFRRFIIKGSEKNMSFNYGIILMPLSGFDISVEDRKHLK